MAHCTRTRSDGEHERLDVLLIGVVLLFTFLASSFLENSSVLWSHLAAGRRLADHSFSLRSILLPSGVFDLALYTIYTGTGGMVLIAFKALGFSMLAWLLMPPRLARSTDATPLFVCTLLAVLTLSPYALLRPAIVSYFFLALTLRLLLAPRQQEMGSSSSGKGDRLVLLAPLFILWVNLDRWFWFGPLLVLLFWMGERLEGFLNSDSGKPDAVPRIPTWLLLVCVFVCLLNPLGIRAFSIPSAWLSHPWWSASPWQASQLASSVQRMDLAALAYLVLVGLGLVSLALPGVRERSLRALAWGSLAVLSSWQSEMVPFFAVVACPLTILNWQDSILAQCRGEKNFFHSAFGIRHSILERWVLLAAGLVLIFLAGIGGLHGLPRGRLVPGWGVDADFSSRQFVETLRGWRQQGWLRADHRILALPLDLVAYFAWFAPEEQHAQEHLDELAALESACRAGKGNLVVVDDLDLFRKLAGAPEHWRLLHVEGRITLWGWNGAYSNGAELQPFAANRLVFAAGDEERTPLPSLPDSTFRIYTPARSFLNRIDPRPGPLVPDSEAASTYLHYFQAGVLPPYQRNRLQGWSAYAANLLAAPPPRAFSMILRLEKSPSIAGEKDLPALPLLAIRAARRALAVHPHDANAYLCLGRAYRFLWETTGERVHCRAASLLAELRQAQAAAALEQAARLDPDSPDAHQYLAELYQEQGYLDAALDHRREEIRLARRTGCRRGEDPQALAKRLQRLEQRTRTLEGMVQERQKRFASLPSSITRPRERAVAALHLGLARLALDDILLPASPILLESSGVNLELELLLRLGRIEQLREWMQGKDLELHGENLGLHNLPAPVLAGYPRTYRLPAAAWFRFVCAAAHGDHEEARNQLSALLQQQETVRQEQLRSLRRSLALSLANEILLSAQPQLLLLQPLGRKDRVTATHLLNPLLTFNGVRADLCVLAGILALERGCLRQAEQDFEMALSSCQQDAGNREDFAARPLAQFYLQCLRAAQEREYPLP